MTPNRIMFAATVAVLAIGCLFLTSCARPKDEQPRPVRTVEVVTPVLEERPVPEELKFTPIPDAELPEWVAPTNPAASSCLTPDGEAKKRILDTGIMGKLGAWEKWGVLP